MSKSSLQKIILINAGAFLFVLLLEIISGLTAIENYDSTYDFFLWQLSYAVMIMAVIWANHLILIPFLLDKKHYFFYGISFLGIVYLGTQFKAFGKDWEYTSKLFFFLIYTTGTGMAFFFLRRSVLFQKRNAEKEKLQKEMELNYLKEQVNPHFLFNSLNSIYSLSKSQSPETPELVMQLSDLMRYQLESAKKDTVLLKEELEFIENYLLLEEKRLSNRCTIEFVLEDNFKDLKIAPMLLIPFVENAIKHGAQSTNEKSKIDISAYVKDATFYFSVTNSKPQHLIENTRKGMGLENVKKRLLLLYPNTHSLEILKKEKEYQISLSIDL